MGRLDNLRVRPLSRRMMIERAIGRIILGETYSGSGDVVETCSEHENDTFAEVTPGVKLYFRPGPKEKNHKDWQCPSSTQSHECCGMIGTAWNAIAADRGSYCGVTGDLSYPVDAADALPGDAFVIASRTRIGNQRSTLGPAGYTGQNNYKAPEQSNRWTKFQDGTLAPTRYAHVQLIRRNHGKQSNGKYKFTIWQQGGGGGKPNEATVYYEDSDVKKSIMRRRNIVEDEAPHRWEDDHYMANENSPGGKKVAFVAQKFCGKAAMKTGACDTHNQKPYIPKSKYLTNQLQTWKDCPKKWNLRDHENCRP